MENIWEESIKIIKEKISSQNYETWIRPLKLASIENNRASLSVPNKFFKDWLTENYREVISQALSTRLRTSVVIRQGRKKGRIEIRYASSEERDRLLALLNPTK